MGSEILNFELYHMHLEWPSRLIWSYIIELEYDFGVKLLEDTANNLFTKNQAFKGVFLC